MHYEHKRRRWQSELRFYIWPFLAFIFSLYTRNSIIPTLSNIPSVRQSACPKLQWGSVSTSWSWSLAKDDCPGGRNLKKWANWVLFLWNWEKKSKTKHYGSRVDQCRVCLSWKVMWTLGLRPPIRSVLMHLVKMGVRKRVCKKRKEMVNVFILFTTFQVLFKLFYMSTPNNNLILWIR